MIALSGPNSTEEALDLALFVPDACDEHYDFICPNSTGIHSRGIALLARYARYGDLYKRFIRPRSVLAFSSQASIEQPFEESVASNLVI